MHLTGMERMALRGLMVRDQAIAQQHIAPLQADFAAWRAEIEQRLGLPAGAIGTTHGVDGDTGTITVLGSAPNGAVSEELVPA